MESRDSLSIKMKNKKAQGLALRTVIILVILLVVLIVVLSFFLGSTKQMFGPISDLVGQTSGQLGEQTGTGDSSGTTCSFISIGSRLEQENLINFNPLFSL